MLSEAYPLIFILLFLGVAANAGGLFVPASDGETQTQQTASAEAELAQFTDEQASIIQDSLPSLVTINLASASQTKGGQPVSTNTSSASTQTSQSIGCGFVVEENGLIATNKRFVYLTPQDYVVITQDGQTMQVNEIFKDPDNDIAILRVQAENLNPLELGDSQDLEIDQDVISMCSILANTTGSAAAVEISEIGYEFDEQSPLNSLVQDPQDIILTDPPIMPENAGGPLLDMQGKVIGINTFGTDTDDQFNFTIAVNQLKDYLTTIE